MAKKTRKEKIATALRREDQPLKFTVPTFSPVSSVTDHSYVFSDLKRIFFMSALAFCAQLVLWYLLHR